MPTGKFVGVPGQIGYITTWMSATPCVVTDDSEEDDFVSKWMEALCTSVENTIRPAIVRELTEKGLTRKRTAQAAEGGICAYCLKRFDKLEVDHILPRAMGGTDDPGNLVSACRQCNASKGDRDLLSFIRSAA